MLFFLILNYLVAVHSKLKKKKEINAGKASLLAGTKGIGSPLTLADEKLCPNSAHFSTVNLDTLSLALLNTS